MTVDQKDMIRMFRRLQTISPEMVRIGLIESMEHVGLKAVSKYMKVRSVVDAATGRTGKRKSAGEKLGVVTSRLARSILGKESTHGQESIRRIVFDGKDMIAEIGSKVPYAAIHEYGGKAGRNKSVRIPQRAYLNPAIDDSDTAIFKIMKTKLDIAVRMAERGV